MESDLEIFLNKILSEKIMKELKYTQDLKDLISREEASPEQKTKFAQAKYNSTDYSQPHDEYFRTYNANHIKNTPYFVGQGPIINPNRYERNPGAEVAALFENTVFNPQTKIARIIRIGYGNTLGSKYHNESSFIEYVLGDQVYQSRENLYTQFRVIDNQQIRGHFGYGVNTHDFYLKGWCENLITIQKEQLIEDKITIEDTKDLTVYSIPISDGSWIHSFDISKKLNDKFDDFDPQRLERDLHWLLKIHDETTLNNPLLIHCSSGVGRAGHLLLAFVLLDQFEEIIDEQSSEQTAENLATLIETLRTSRAALLANPDQVKFAIALAYKLREIKNRL